MSLLAIVSFSPRSDLNCMQIALLSWEVLCPISSHSQVWADSEIAGVRYIEGRHLLSIFDLYYSND